MMKSTLFGKSTRLGTSTLFGAAMALFCTTISAQADVLQLPGYTTGTLTSVSGWSGWGAMHVADDGNIYAGDGGNGKLYRISTTTGSVTELFDLGRTSLGITQLGDRIYFAGDSGHSSRGAELFYYDLGTGQTTSLGGNGGLYFNQLAVIPNGFGSHGGKLVAAAADGVWIVDPLTGGRSLLANPGHVSDVKFISDGRMIIMNYQSNFVQEVFANGSVSNLYGMSGGDGLTIHEGTNEIVTASSSQSNLYLGQVNSTSVSVLMSAISINRGYYPHRVDFSHDHTRLYYFSDNAIRYIDGFDSFVASPSTGPSGSVPTGTAIGGLLLAGLAARRLR